MLLEEINISTSGVTDLEAIKKMPLKKINIRNTGITDLNILKYLNGLEELEVDCEKFPNARESIKNRF